MNSELVCIKNRIQRCREQIHLEMLKMHKVSDKELISDLLGIDLTIDWSDIIYPNDYGWQNISTDELFTESLKTTLDMDSELTPSTSNMSSATKSEIISASTSDASIEMTFFNPLDIKAELQSSDESSDECSPQPSTSQLVKKRGRGRPRITDPKVAKRNKLNSQIKASKKYRQKKKEKSNHDEKEREDLLRLQSRLITQYIRLFRQCNDYLKKCNEIKPRLKPKEKKLLAESEKAIDSAKPSFKLN